MVSQYFGLNTLVFIVATHGVTIMLLHSAAPVHTLALEVGRVTIQLLHSWAVTLKETNGISNLYNYEYTIINVMYLHYAVGCSSNFV